MLKQALTGATPSGPPPARRHNDTPTMLYELARATVQRILQDKILLGLIIVLILGFFVSGMNKSGEPAVADKATSARVQAQLDAQASQTAQATQSVVEPSLATDFVKWWLTRAMDFAPATALQSHNEAFAWMMPEALSTFQQCFWTPDTAAAVANGQLIASFQTGNIVAEAINPDGTVVVGVTGALVVTGGSQPVAHEMTADFLVRRVPEGLRIAGVYNKLTPVPGSSVY